MLVLGILLAGALGTQVVAPFMDGASGTPLALGMLVLGTVSLLLIVPYPKAESRDGTRFSVDGQVRQPSSRVAPDTV